QEECRAFPGPMARQPPIHPWRRPLVRGLDARSSVTGSVFPTDMGYIGASGFASENYFYRTVPAPERRAMFVGVAGPCSTERVSPGSPRWDNQNPLPCLRRPRQKRAVSPSGGTVMLFGVGE